MKRALLFLALVLAFATTATAQNLDMRWRMVGPFRGGRTKAATGIADQPNVFYVGYVAGGVWKSTDYGRVWKPIFDEQSSGSIGAIAVAPSNPNVVYVGSGEGLQRPDLTVGDGIYRSSDAGATWTHLGLRDAQQIPMIIVDPRNADRLFVAALGHPFGPNAERGIFRSTDGGKSFEKVLYRDERTGGIDVQFDPTNPDVVYAALWEQQQLPWENGVRTGKGSGLYKSTDGGTTWQQIGKGLPTGDEGLGRIGLGMSMSQHNRIYAIIGSPARLGGVYRSDDSGENWTRINTDARLWGRDGDFNEIEVDPTNADIAYVANVESWKTTDGGKTFLPYRGAPGGDDPQRFWVNPKNPNIILLAGDQGVMITVNNGDTWSSWYNQPTAQLYHVNADNAFPYRVCSGQQESGSACVQSRSDYGGIGERDWSPVGAEEYGYVVPDPLDPDIIYGGKISRYDRRTKQTQNITPKLFRSKDYRVLRTMPIAFAPTDARTLYFASNVVWKTLNGGNSWTQISPDLTRDTAQTHHTGVIYSLAPSYLKTNIIWAGTDDGSIHVTWNGGKTWKDVSPPYLREHPWAKVSVIDASHFDSLTAYAAINTLRLDDMHAHILRTHDGGKTWVDVGGGIPAGHPVNVVREDSKRRGLLFAGSERQIFVSYDDGEHWESLRLNMPATSIRDLIIKDNDVVVGTHGRGFWILDDIAPLRQMSSNETKLVKPSTATRFRWQKWPDTPIPPDEPMGENPPDGAIIDYQLASNAQSVALDILYMGKVVRHYSSSDTPEPMLEGTNVPPYWIRPSRALSNAAGMHRFVWDMHHERPAAVSFDYPIQARPHNTVAEPQGVWAMPGAYTVRLTVDGKAFEQPLTVRMDPRVKTPLLGLKRQYDLSLRVNELLKQSKAAGLTQLNDELANLFTTLQEVDVAPTVQLVDAINQKEAELRKALSSR